MLRISFESFWKIFTPALVQQQNGVDVSDTVKKGEDSRLVDPDAIIAAEEQHEAELAALAARRPPRRPAPGKLHRN